MRVYSRKVNNSDPLLEKYNLIARWDNPYGRELADCSLEDASGEAGRQYYILHPYFKRCIVAAAYTWPHNRGCWELCCIGSTIKGGGTAIIDTIIRDMRKVKAKRLRLYADSEAVGFYKKYGFRHIRSGSFSLEICKKRLKRKNKNV